MRSLRHLGPVVLATTDEDLIQATRRALAECPAGGPRLSTVSDSPDCLLALRLLDPCFLILDDGLDVPGKPPAHTVLNEPFLPPVVYIAAHHTLELERKIRQLGALFYFARPETPEQLESLLAFVVRALQNRAR